MADEQKENKSSLGVKGTQESFQFECFSTTFFRKKGNRQMNEKTALALISWMEAITNNNPEAAPALAAFQGISSQARVEFLVEPLPCACGGKPIRKIRSIKTKAKIEGFAITCSECTAETVAAKKEITAVVAWNLMQNKVAEDAARTEAQKLEK